jgi:Fe-S-cluster containining protein
MCCDGVLFHTVQMQSIDSPGSLLALGLRLERKRGQTYLLQPCPALGDSGCSIYHARPLRCRLFECRQLQRLANAEITEQTALGAIQSARRLVAEVVKLLERMEGTSSKRPLSKRWKAVLAMPMDASTPVSWVADRDRLVRAIQELIVLLDRDFRIVPVGDTDVV